MKILKPINDGHGGDTFRELLDMWAENNLCEVIPTPNIRNVWVGSVGNILLYDRPILDFLPPNFKFGLFGNTVPNFTTASPWIFWGRRPRILEEYRKKEYLPYGRRSIESIFVGKVENPVQFQKRTSTDWSRSIDLFEMPISQGHPIVPYKYTQQQYLDLLRKSKFGLCLPGYGPKCNREIELMALGVVPIITPGVDLNYFNPLIKDKHYICVDTPQKLKSTIADINQTQWEEMSKSCMDWFKDNCSIQGSFDTTQKILTTISL
tara:strand:- start:17535 stop:18326 length:792 start_codon:yes stop_codon:yes gene_type:complete